MTSRRAGWTRSCRRSSRRCAEHRDAGGTVFLSSHDLDEVERICDRAGIVRDGRLIAVEDVAAMRERAYRHVAVRFAREVPPSLLDGVPGVEETERDETTVRFRVRGAIDSVIKALAAHRVQDVEIARPTLEELFLTYYGDRSWAPSPRRAASPARSRWRPRCRVRSRRSFATACAGSVARCWPGAAVSARSAR